VNNMGDTVDCYQYTTCSECLSNNPGCAWCKNDAFAFCYPNDSLIPLLSCNLSEVETKASSCPESKLFWMCLLILLLVSITISGIMVAFFWGRLCWMQRKDHARRARSISKQSKVADSSAANKAAKHSKRAHKREMRRKARMINKRVEEAEKKQASGVETPTDERLFNPVIRPSVSPFSPKSPQSPSSLMTTTTTTTIVTEKPKSSSATATPLNGKSLVQRRSATSQIYEPSYAKDKAYGDDAAGSESDDDPFHPPPNVVAKLSASQQLLELSSPLL